MNKIRFSHVWDKLNDPVFTTIRPWNKEKEAYYHSKVNSRFQVWKSKETYPFRLEYVICHAYLLYSLVANPEDLDNEMLRKDVSMNGTPDMDWMEKIRKMKKVIVLTFTKAEPKQVSLETR